jgi:hypothetical protein
VNSLEQHINQLEKEYDACHEVFGRGENSSFDVASLPQRLLHCYLETVYNVFTQSLQPFAVSKILRWWNTAHDTMKKGTLVPWA